MTTKSEIGTVARAAISDGLSHLIQDMRARDEDPTDNAVWKPAQRTFLEAVVRSAQLRLAEENLPSDSEQRVHFPPDPDSRPVPHSEHTVNGPEDCRRCQLLRENQHWMALPRANEVVTEEGDYDRQGNRRAWCMGTAPHAEHEFNGGMWCPGLTDPVPESPAAEHPHTIIKITWVQPAGVHWVCTCGTSCTCNQEIAISEMIRHLSQNVNCPDAARKDPTPMTDRHTAYLVTLNAPIREDDSEVSVLAALRMIKGVASVEPVIADGLTEQAAASRRDLLWQDVLADLVNSGPPENR